MSRRRHPARLAASLLGAALASAAAMVAPAAAADSAVVVMYHRFGESRFPSTNVTLEQFDSHLKELASGPYTVWPLPAIVEALRRRQPLPERTLGISVDDAYLSVYTEAWPRLRKAGLPFTLFVATDPLDRKLPGMLSWDQLREMAAAGVTIGGHTASHLHMATASEARNRAEIERSATRLAAELGARPGLFAYPYGEASLAAAKVVASLGFVAAFGQHSAALGASEDPFYLPRFAMNEQYGEIARFRLAVNALPLPAFDVTPADPLVAGDNPPAIGFTVAPGVDRLDRLACFASHEGRARVERLGESRFEVRVEKPFPKGRTRLNCTLPAADGRWRWFGRQFYVPE